MSPHNVCAQGLEVSKTLGVKGRDIGQYVEAQVEWLIVDPRMDMETCLTRLVDLQARIEGK